MKVTRLKVFRGIPTKDFTNTMTTFIPKERPKQLQEILFNSKDGHFRLDFGNLDYYVFVGKENAEFWDIKKGEFHNHKETHLKKKKVNGPQAVPFE